MKGLLLRVGIDKGTGGCLSPLFRDGTFEFIPIPENRATTERRVYLNMTGTMHKDIRIADFVPKKHQYSHPHYDPEFETFTYGDPTRIKRSQLSKLSPGDMLIFYVGMKEREGGREGLYVIGYFEVEKVHDFRDIRGAEFDDTFKKLRGNAHSRIYFRLKELGIKFEDKDLVIVKGSKDSKLLRKALPLGDKNGKMHKEFADIFGYEGNLKRAVGHKIDENHIGKVKRWLKKNPRSGFHHG